MNKQNRVCLKDGLIQFDSSNQSDWSLDVGKIRVVIEYTTEEGPFVPDHFLVFVDCSATEYHLPLDTLGCSEVIEQVRKVLGTAVDLKLSSSTSFTSRVVFPNSIAGVEGYKLEITRRSLMRKLFNPGQEVTMILSDQVQKFL